jgi:Mlc titration factor MtfA (ptsG expression regulator)
MFGFKKRRRERIKREPFPEGWLAHLERNVPYYQLLNEDERAELRGDVKVFLAEKTFEGCGGQEITDEVCVTIAAQACVLLLHRDTDFYPELLSVLVYPEQYFAPSTRHLADGTVVEQMESRIGEAWDRGEVVLSWDDVLYDAEHPADGDNVVFHEFAHQLDNESGPHDGTPRLPSRALYAAWGEVFTREFKQLVDDRARRRRTVLRKYGATNPAEFFAVATEAFFEKPRELLARHPEMYELLAAYYRQDPAARLAGIALPPDDADDDDDEPDPLDEIGELDE